MKNKIVKEKIENENVKKTKIEIIKIIKNIEKNFCYMLKKRYKNNNLEQEKNIEKNQEKFLETNLGKIINSGLDIGLKTILPDLIEDEIIFIKDCLIII